MTPRGTPKMGGRVKVEAAPRHVSSGAIPRIDDGRRAQEIQEVQVLLIGPPADAQNEVIKLLSTLSDPGFKVEHVPIGPGALEKLMMHVCDVAVLTPERVNETMCAEFLRDAARKGNSIPLFTVTEGDPARRGVLRAEARGLGAHVHLLRADLSAALLAHALHEAVELGRVRRALISIQERFALAVRGANDGLWEWNLESNEAFFSRRWKELLGYEVDQVSNAIDEWFNRVHPNDLARLRANLRNHIEGREPIHEDEHRVRALDGSYRWVLSRGVVQRNAKGDALRMAGSLTDISDFRLREQKLREESRYDALTELPRRELFMERLARAVELAREYEDYTFAVLYIDVDRFRIVNDSIGQRAGDAVLTMLARRLESCVGPEDVVSRFGGDKFTILLEDVHDASEATHVADSIHNAVREPFEVDGQTVYTTVSIGMTSSARNYQRAEDAVSDVSAAAGRAKDQGHDRHEIFNTQMRIEALTLLRLEMALRQAVERNEFKLKYQPIVSLESGFLVGFEALIRWQHPRRGVVPPNEFIPVAENTGMIIPIGRWVIHEAARQLRKWQQEFGLTDELSISVNLSGKQIADSRLLPEIDAALSETGLSPHVLKFELTESVVMENADVVTDLLNSLRTKGLRIYIDDFGTGYSSLSYLHQFPVDGLKIDKSFIDPLDGTEQSSAIVRTILNLAKNMNVDVVAEGIEHRAQADVLRKLGCESGQGYLFGAPLSIEDARRLISGA